MKKKKDSLTPLKDIIASVLGDGTLPFDPADVDIWKVWDEVTGPAISNHTRPSWIKNRQLRVTVSDPIWLQELIFLEEDIRTKLNEKLCREAVKKIEFRMGM